MENIDKNPTVYVNPSQPLMASVEVRSQSIELNEVLFNVDGLALRCRDIGITFTLTVCVSHIYFVSL